MTGAFSVFRRTFCRTRGIFRGQQNNDCQDGDGSRSQKSHVIPSLRLTDARRASIARLQIIQHEYADRDWTKGHSTGGHMACEIAHINEVATGHRG